MQYPPTYERFDDSRINITEDYERRYWSELLQVSEEQLKWAVEKAGPLVRDVRVELGLSAATP